MTNAKEYQCSPLARDEASDNDRHPENLLKRRSKPPTQKYQAYRERKKHTKHELYASFDQLEEDVIDVLDFFG